jgi:hypothetical protein
MEFATTFRVQKREDSRVEQIVALDYNKVLTDDSLVSEIEEAGKNRELRIRRSWGRNTEAVGIFEFYKKVCYRDR